MPLDRKWYVDTIRHWVTALEDRWDEACGYYRIPQSTRSNGMLIPPLIVLINEGEQHWKERIPRMAARMIQSPPYDERYRYFNWNLNQTGGEIHEAGCMTQVGLGFALRYGDELGLASDLRAEIAHKLHDSLERLAEFARYVKNSEFSTTTEADGTPVDVAKERALKVARGEPEDFGRLIGVGPSNQSCWEMRACVYAWKTTGNSDYLDFADRAWARMLQDGTDVPYRTCFSEDGSFIYSPRNPLFDYTQSMYEVGLFCQYADCVRVMRQAGRSTDATERFMKRWGNAALSRSLLSDGSNNMVFNSYGWERSIVGATHGEALWLHPVISVADLTPCEAGVIKSMFERGAKRLRDWDFRYPFAPDLGIIGWAAGQLEDRVFFPYELGLMLLDNPGAVETPTSARNGHLSSLAWKEGNFVMQTDAYQATVVGTSPGYDGTRGIPMSGGEFMVRIPDGDYLFPLSDAGRTSLAAIVEGQALRSSEITKWNAVESHFEMTVRDPVLRVSYGTDSARLTREMSFDSSCIAILDRLTALRDVTVEQAHSRIPIIIVNPRNEEPEITGSSDGTAVTIRPPYSMGPAGADALSIDHHFIQSLRRLQLLRVAYAHYGFEVRQQGDDEIRLAISPWSWQENRRMRCDGKNLDYIWVFEPVRLRAGETRQFCYEIRPFSDGYTL